MCVLSSFSLKYNATFFEKISLVVEYTHIYFDIYIFILSYKTLKDYFGDSLRNYIYIYILHVSAIFNMVRNLHSLIHAYQIYLHS